MNQMRTQGQFGPAGGPVAMGQVGGANMVKRQAANETEGIPVAFPEDIPVALPQVGMPGGQFNPNNPFQNQMGNQMGQMGQMGQ